MILWIDAQLSPAIATWIKDTFTVPAVALRDIGLRDASDHQIFMMARQQQAIVVTKDSDFPKLLEKHGTPPQVIWITCGNTSNANLKRILAGTLVQARHLLQASEELIEISGD